MKVPAIAIFHFDKALHGILNAGDLLPKRPRSLTKLIYCVNGNPIRF